MLERMAVVLSLHPVGRVERQVDLGNDSPYGPG